jgi:error-prone DNA polymerase
MVSFKSAWLKTYHQAEFIAAVISNQGGYYSASAYVSEARRLGLTVRMPDINQSRVEYTSDPPSLLSAMDEHETEKLRRTGALRVGLMQIKGLEQKLAETIVAERERNGIYKNLVDLLYRLNPDPEQARILIKAGTFDDLEGVDRRTALLWIINTWEKARPKSQKGFFPIDCRAPAALRKFSEPELLAQEQEMFGFLLSRHPLSLYRDRLKNLALTPAAEFKNKIGQRVTAAGWCVTGKLAETSKGEAMEFVSFEDETDIFETVFFPDAYRRYCHLLNRDVPFLLFGKVSQDLSAISLEIERIQPLSKTRPAQNSETGQQTSPSSTACSN